MTNTKRLHVVAVPYSASTPSSIFVAQWEPRSCSPQAAIHRLLAGGWESSTSPVPPNSMTLLCTQSPCDSPKTRSAICERSSRSLRSALCRLGLDGVCRRSCGGAGRERALRMVATIEYCLLARRVSRVFLMTLINSVARHAGGLGREAFLRLVGVLHDWSDGDTAVARHRRCAQRKRVGHSSAREEEHSSHDGHELVAGAPTTRSSPSHLLRNGRRGGVANFFTVEDGHETAR